MYYHEFRVQMSAQWVSETSSARENIFTTFQLFHWRETKVIFNFERPDTKLAAAKILTQFVTNFDPRVHSRTLKHTPTHTLTNMHSRTRTHPHVPTLTHTHSPTWSRTRTHSQTHTRTLSLCLFRPHISALLAQNLSLFCPGDLSITSTQSILNIKSPIQFSYDNLNEP